MINREKTLIEVNVSENGDPVTEIGNKEFLSFKSVYKLVIGENVRKIGDWAFAYMEKLEQVVLPCHDIVWGKQAFLGCGRLMKIQIREDESGNPGTPWFLASAVRILKEEKLLKPEKAGSSVNHREWIKEYDKSLFQFIESPDQEGFDPVFIGWFDVEDTDDQLPRHLLKRRTEKTELILQRLLYPDFLTEKEENILKDYLRKHMPGKEKRDHEVVFEVLCDEEKEYARDMRYMRILEEKQLLGEDVLNAFLENMENFSPEIKAFLLRKKGEMMMEKDIFEAFEL